LSKHVVIADTQVKPGYDLSYLTAIGKFIAQKKPEVIIHIGDHFDFESLSSYDKGKQSFEGRRVKEDLESGHEGMKLLMQPILDLQETQRKAKKKVYNPRLVFCLGNHEARADRFANDNPEFTGFIGTAQLGLEQYGERLRHGQDSPMGLIRSCGERLSNKHLIPLSGL